MVALTTISAHVLAVLTDCLTIQVCHACLDVLVCAVPGAAAAATAVATAAAARGALTRVRSFGLLAAATVRLFAAVLLHEMRSTCSRQVKILAERALPLPSRVSGRTAPTVRIGGRGDSRFTSLAPALYGLGRGWRWPRFRNLGSLSVGAAQEHAKRVLDEHI
jgi:hypothetical protein